MRFALILLLPAVLLACAPPEADADLGPSAARADWPRIVPLRGIAAGAIAVDPEAAAAEDALLARGAAVTAPVAVTAEEAARLRARAAALRARAATLTGEVMDAETRDRIDAGP